MRSTRRFLWHIIVIGALLGNALEIAPAFAQKVESVGSAGSAEALRAATDLMAIMSPTMIDQLSQQLATAIWPSVQNSLGSKVDAATMSDLRSEFERQLGKFNSEGLKDIPALYAKYFSAQELQEMAAFYRGATGAKALQLMPRLMGEYMTGALPRIQDFQNEFAISIREVMKKHGYAN